MFDISIVFVYLDSDFPPNSLSLLFTFPLFNKAQLTFLWYDYFGENHTPLHRNGMAATSKRQKAICFNLLLNL